MVFLVLMVGLDGEVSDNAPFVVSHLVLLATVCGARIAENRRRRGLMVANRSGSGT
jgi:hypothetical protein